VSITRGGTLDGPCRCDESNPTGEPLEALLGRQAQAFLDEAEVVLVRNLNQAT
jgi:hypothetical protein